MTSGADCLEIAMLGNVQANTSSCPGVTIRMTPDDDALSFGGGGGGGGASESPMSATRNLSVPPRTRWRDNEGDRAERYCLMH